MRAVLTLVVALGVLAFSCGTPSTCTAGNCPGCCDSSGACQPGNSSVACGSGGSRCEACRLSETCGAGACLPGSGGGAAGGTAGGAAGGTAGGAAGGAAGGTGGVGSAGGAGGGAAGGSAGGAGGSGGGAAGGSAGGAGGGAAGGVGGGGTVSYGLSVTLSGNGAGHVTSSPSGIDCGFVCSAPFDSGTVVTLSQTASTGSVFTGWSGACGGTGVCAVTLDQARNVTASFTLIDAGAGGGGGTAGGSGGGSAGGSAGGSGGGGSAGGSGGGGSAGGSGGGGSAGGSGGGGGNCNIATQDCPSGSACMVSSLSGPTLSCFPGACDLVSQDCSNTFDRCLYVQDGGVVRGCAPAGTLMDGQACNPSADQCAKGLACLTMPQPDGGTASTCQKFCYTSGDCGSSRPCTTLVSVPGSNEIPLVCTAACNPLTQDCPVATDGCYPSTQGNVCVPAGTLADGQTCPTGPSGPSQMCTKGSLCVTQLGTDGGTLSVCRRLCNPSGSPVCAVGTCVQLAGSSLGACL